MKTQRLRPNFPHLNSASHFFIVIGPTVQLLCQLDLLRWAFTITMSLNVLYHRLMSYKSSHQTVQLGAAKRVEAVLDTACLLHSPPSGTVQRGTPSLEFEMLGCCVAYGRYGRHRLERGWTQTDRRRPFCSCRSPS